MGNQTSHCRWIASAAAAVILALVADSHAADVRWTSPESGAWDDAARWTPASAPGANSQVTIDATGSPYTVNIAADATARSLSLSSPQATLSVAPGRSLTLSGLTWNAGNVDGQVVVTGTMFSPGVLSLGTQTAGAVSLSGGGQLNSLVPGQRVIIPAGVRLRPAQSTFWDIAADALENNGMLDASDPTLSFIEGSGSFSPFKNNGVLRVIRNSIPDGYRIIANFEQSHAGRIELGGVFGAQLRARGSLLLAGTLDVSGMDTSAAPMLQSLAVIESNNSPGRVGTFDRIEGVIRPGGLGLAVTYNARNVLATLARLGDTNLSATVNFTDLLVVAQNYNRPAGQTWSTGDFTGDGAVGFADLIELARNYNTPAGFIADWSLAQSIVPEPATVTTLAAMMGLMLRRRR
jgi:hypothetical protein